ENTLRCERLNIEFVKPGGAQKLEALQNVEMHQGDIEIRSGQAVYEVKTNLIRILEHPVWAANQGNGSADIVGIDVTNDTLNAHGHVYMKLPATNAVLSVDAGQTNTPGTNRFVEIRAQQFDYQSARSNRQARAVYTGMVRASQDAATL